MDSDVTKKRLFGADDLKQSSQKPKLPFPELVEEAAKYYTPHVRIEKQRCYISIDNGVLFLLYICGWTLTITKSFAFTVKRNTKLKSHT